MLFGFEIRGKPQPLVCVRVLSANFFLSTLFSLSLWVTASDTKPQAEAEIDYLLERVAMTPCEYHRNGKVYSGAEAHKHILRKYDYFRDDIKTAEDFIRLAASKSTFSGKFYKFCARAIALLKAVTGCCNTWKYIAEWSEALKTCFKNHGLQTL